MDLKISIRGLTFDLSETFLLNGQELVVITGANNSGKSVLLREIYSCVASTTVSEKRFFLTSIKTDHNFDENQLHEHMRLKYPNAFRPHEQILMFGTSTHIGTLNIIGQHYNGYQFLTQLFASLVETKSRLSDVSAPAMFDRTSENPEHPIQKLFADESLEKKLSDRFEAAFGVGLIVHRGAGSKIPLYVGSRPDWTKENDRTSVEYLKKIEALPKLENQGDGMKAFAAILLRMMTFDRSVPLIDEPEAFLHPPQARLIGRIIAEEREQGKQMFVATHSVDVLQGIIEAKSSNLKFLRLSRDDNKTIRYWLKPDSAEKFVKDSLLRTSNALESLFHSGVVLCEGDRDALFYRELLVALTKNDKDRDILFISTGGKDRMPEFVDALSELGVDPIIIADVDLIRSDQTLAKLLTAKNVKNTEIIRNAARIVTEVNQRNVQISARSLSQNIQSQFEEVDKEKPTPKSTLSKIKALLDEVSPFSSVKKTGYRAPPHGDCQRLYREVDRELQALQIWLVPEGEIEGFLRTGGRKGKEWIADALAREIEADPDLKAARDFVRMMFRLE